MSTPSLYAVRHPDLPYFWTRSGRWGCFNMARTYSSRERAKASVRDHARATGDSLGPCEIVELPMPPSDRRADVV